MVMGVKEIYCGGHLAIYTNIGSLCYTSETDIILYVNYSTKKKKKLLP